MRQCAICASEQAKYVDTLLRTGSSIRQVSRNTRFSRSTVARHREHVQVTGSRFAVLRGGGGPDGSTGPVDPLSEALALARRARSDRERPRAAEAVRSATALRMRAFRGGELDRDMLEQLDGNIAEAAALYRRVGGSFDNELRALAGHREAVRQRLEAGKMAKAGGMIEVPLVVWANGKPLPLPTSEEQRPQLARLTPEQYWAGVPARFRDHERFDVHRRVDVQLSGPSRQTIKVYEVGTDALVWAKDER